MRFVSFCPPLSGRVIEWVSNSANLYIVIITIICAIYTLYVVFVLIWLHLSFIVFNSVSHNFLWS
jgi:hypothetical protein